jgi:hypothetical protein
VPERIAGHEVHGMQTGAGRGQQHLRDISGRALGRAELGLVGRDQTDGGEHRLGHGPVEHDMVDAGKSVVRAAGE